MIDLTNADKNIEDLSTGKRVMLGLTRTETSTGTSLPVEFINSLLLEMCGLIQWKHEPYYDEKLKHRLVSKECTQMVNAIYGRYFLKNLVKHELYAKLICQREDWRTKPGHVEYRVEDRRGDVSINFAEGFFIEPYYKWKDYPYKLLYCNSEGVNYTYDTLPNVWKGFGCVTCFGIKRYYGDRDDYIFPIAISSFFDDTEKSAWLEILDLNTGKIVAYEDEKYFGIFPDANRATIQNVII